MEFPRPAVGAEGSAPVGHFPSAEEVGFDTLPRHKFRERDGTLRIRSNRMVT